MVTWTTTGLLIDEDGGIYKVRFGGKCMIIVTSGKLVVYLVLKGGELSFISFC